MTTSDALLRLTRNRNFVIGLAGFGVILTAAVARKTSRWVARVFFGWPKKLAQQ